MQNLNNKLRKLKKEKKGASMVEFAINMMIFLMIVVIGIELVLLSANYILINDYTNELTRTIAIQGGIRTSAPSGFPGGSSNYTTSKAAMDRKNAIASGLGMSTNDIKIIIYYKQRGTSNNYTVTLSNTSVIEVDYLDTFYVTVEFTPKIRLVDSYTNFKLGKVSKTKFGISEYLYNYDT